MRRVLLGFGAVAAVAYCWKRFVGATPQKPSWEETDNDPEDRFVMGDPGDPMLVDRVKSEVFRDERFPQRDVDVNAEYGRVILRGRLESADMIDALVERVRNVDGVVGVESRLTTRG